MSLPKDPTKIAAYLQKLSDSHKGQIPHNIGIESPFKGKTYAEIGRGPSPLLGRERPQKDRDKISKGHLLRLGKDKPSEERDGPLVSRWREQVKKRDNYTCQSCKITQAELPRIVGDPTTWINAHHIRPWAIPGNEHLRYEITNGISLCWDCHKKAHNWQIALPESIAPAEQKKKGWPKGKKRGKATYIRTEIQLTAQREARLKLIASGWKSIGKKAGRKPGSIPHNKGLNNIERYGLEKAAKLSKIAAENARKNKNRLGTGQRINSK